MKFTSTQFNYELEGCGVLTSISVSGDPADLTISITCSNGGTLCFKRDQLTATRDAINYALSTVDVVENAILKMVPGKPPEDLNEALLQNSISVGQHGEATQAILNQDNQENEENNTDEERFWNVYLRDSEIDNIGELASILQEVLGCTEGPAQRFANDASSGYQPRVLSKASHQEAAEITRLLRARGYDASMEEWDDIPF